MWRLTRLLLTLFLGLSMTTGTAVVFGRRQPQPKHVAALHFGDCSPPCWVGIHPGKTTIAQAKILIEKAGASSPGVGIEFRQPDSLFNYGLGSDSAVSTEIDLISTSELDHAPVTGISFGFVWQQNREFSLGDLALVLPPPTYLRYIEKEPPGPPYFVALVYVLDVTIMCEAAVSTQSPLRPTDPVLQLRFFNTALPDPHTSDYRPWRGLTTLENYFSSQP